MFEDYFSEVQADMVAVCLEYVENEADDIYIYCSYEPEMYAFDVFFKINNHLVHKHHVNEAVNSGSSTGEKVMIDTSTHRQEAVLDIGIENVRRLHEICKEYGREMPTEIKLHYNVKNGDLKGKYRYDCVYSNDEVLLPDDIFDLWFEEVSKGMIWNRYGEV